LRSSEAMTTDRTIGKRRQSALDEVPDPSAAHRVHSRYSSRDAEMLRRQQLKAHATTGNGQQRQRFVTVTLSVAVLLCCTATMAAGNWTESTAPVTVTVPAAGGQAATTYAVTAELGFWELCNCTAASDSGYFCPRHQRLMEGQQATSVLTVLFQAAGLALFFTVSLLVSEAGATLRWACCACYAAAAAAAVVSWILPIAVVSSPLCADAGNLGGASAASYSDRGLILHWAFGFRLCESGALVVLAVAAAMRARGAARAWYLMTGLGITTAVLSIVTTSVHHWVGTPGLSAARDTHQALGPWGICDCVGVVHRCADLAPAYRAVQAFAVLRMLLQVAQILAVTVRPSQLRPLPPVLYVALSWVTWLFHLVTAATALGTFSRCGCGAVHSQQSFDWPLALDAVAFWLQLGLAVHVTVGLARRRLLSWALEESAAMQAEDAAAAEAATVVLTADPYGDTDSDAGSVQGSPTASPAMSPVKTGFAPTAQLPRRR
jgi:hypothetical protein